MKSRGNRLVIQLLMLTLPSAVWAQKSFDDEVNGELDRMYQQQLRNQGSGTVPTAGGQASPQTVQVNVQSPPAAQAVQIPSQTAVQKQPTTVIEAAPLTESRVEKMRRARQESELQTEQKIVEKLELSRIEDERRRSEILFGDKFNQMQNGVNKSEPTAAPVVQAPIPPAAGAPAAPATLTPAPATPIPVMVMNPPPTEVKDDSEKAESMDRDSVRSEISAALADEKAKAEAAKGGRKTYMSLLGGVDSYNNNNVTSQYALGLGVGTRLNEKIMFEGQFNYSAVQVGLPTFLDPSTGRYFYGLKTDVRQYQGVVLMKYAMSSGSFRPLVGAAAAYSYRVYDASNAGLTNYGATSNAIDFGVLGGADFDLSENMAIGFEARYMWNLSNQIQANNNSSNSQSGGTSLESLGYAIIGVTAKVTF